VSLRDIDSTYKSVICCKYKLKPRLLKEVGVLRYNGRQNGSDIKSDSIGIINITHSQDTAVPFPYHIILR
jgi:hypothetical protein